jgi:hypothetical protein
MNLAIGGGLFMPFLIHGTIDESTKDLSLDILSLLFELGFIYLSGVIEPSEDLFDFGSWDRVFLCVASDFPDILFLRADFDEECRVPVVDGEEDLSQFVFQGILVLGIGQVVPDATDDSDGVWCIGVFGFKEVAVWGFEFITFSGEDGLELSQDFIVDGFVERDDVINKFFGLFHGYTSLVS